MLIVSINIQCGISIEFQFVAHAEPQPRRHHEPELEPSDPQRPRADHRGAAPADVELLHVRRVLDGQARQSWLFRVWRLCGRTALPGLRRFLRIHVEAGLQSGKIDKTTHTPCRFADWLFLLQSHASGKAHWIGDCAKVYQATQASKEKAALIAQELSTRLEKLSANSWRHFTL